MPKAGRPSGSDLLAADLRPIWMTLWAMEVQRDAIPLREERMSGGTGLEGFGSPFPQSANMVVSQPPEKEDYVGRNDEAGMPGDSERDNPDGDRAS